MLSQAAAWAVLCPPMCVSRELEQEVRPAGIAGGSFTSYATAHNELGKFMSDTAPSGEASGLLRSGRWLSYLIRINRFPVDHLIWFYNSISPGSIYNMYLQTRAWARNKASGLAYAPTVCHKYNIRMTLEINVNHLPINIAS